jgi:tRNA threonylcarbamoyladenosine modification (KEOPS) complex  Pcc1 subunit
MKAEATIQLKFPTTRYREIIAKSLEPETRKAITARSSATIENKNQFLTLRVEADDTVALRSTLNAYLRWICSVMSVLATVEKQ